MMPIELHWLVEATHTPRMFGSMSEDDIRKIYHDTYGDD